jgi:hypothetical protein
VEANILKRISLLILSVLIFIILSGCNEVQKKSNTHDLQNTNNNYNACETTQSLIKSVNSQNISNSNNEEANSTASTDNSNLSKLGLDKEDFDINYKDIVINDSIPFEQIAKKLGIIFGEADNINIEIKAACSVKNNDYSWYVVHYPSREKEELRIEYVMNETMKKEYIVCASLLKIKTYRDVGIGDDEKKLLAAYGDFVKPQGSNNEYYSYKPTDSLEGTDEDKGIHIAVDKNIKKVIDITIYYNNARAMKELEIDSFD